MRIILNRLFEVREDEGLKVLIMFFYIFLIVASMMILKPVRNSLFLVEFGAEKLPFVFVLVALFAAITTALRSKFDKHHILNRQILTTLIFSILSLLIFWFLLRYLHHHGPLLFVFYVWVSIYSVLATTQFWLLANYIFNAREAKRLFGLIGAGAISGGIFGGYLTNVLAPRLNTENLIFFCIGFLTICIVLLLTILTKFPEQLRQEKITLRKSIQVPDQHDSSIRLILSSRHLTVLTGLIWVGVVVGNLADYQFNAVASSVISDTDKLTAFFGFWMSNLNILSLFIQLLLTSRIIKHYGVGASLLFLPIGLLFGTLTILITPALWSAICIKTSDGAFKHSINRSGTELLAIPIPQNIKNKAKAFIDVVIKNLATGSAGLFLILLTTVMHFSVRHVSIISIVMIIFWIYLIIIIKGEYVNSFRNAILKRSIDLEQQTLNIEDATVLSGLLKVLDGDNERQIIYVLSLLEGIKNKQLVQYIKRFIHHPSDDIKVISLRIAHKYHEPDLSDEVKTLVDTGDQTVRIEAIRYLYERSDDKIKTLEKYLHHNDIFTQNAALIVTAEKTKTKKEIKNIINIRRLLEDKYKTIQSTDPGDDRTQLFLVNMAAVIGISGDPDLYPYLGAMFSNMKYPKVVQAAVKSAGQTKEMEFVPLLLRHLKTRYIRRYSRESLAEFGENIVPTLAECLENPAEDMRIRLEIPKVLTLIGSQKSVDVLLINIKHDDLSLLYSVIKALNKLRVNQPDLLFDKTLINNKILNELSIYKKNSYLLQQQNYFINNVLSGERQTEHSEIIIKARRLLIRALEESLDYNLERIFRLLGLIYDPKDMYDAYLGIKNPKSNIRANAVEFLENILETGLKKLLMPIVEIGPEAIDFDELQYNMDTKASQEYESLKILLSVNDTWIKACTIYVIALMRYINLRDDIIPLQTDPNSLIKETARYCLSKIDSLN